MRGFARVKKFNGREYVYWIEPFRLDGIPKQEVKYLCKLNEFKKKFKNILKLIK